MKESLIDTDILSYFFKGDPRIIRHFGTYLNLHQRISISIITYFEIVSGLYIHDARSQKKKFEAFCSHQNILGVSTATATIAARIVAELQKKGNRIDNQDILIAATALEHDLVLITNNERHFVRISNLEINNWKKL